MYLCILLSTQRLYIGTYISIFIYLSIPTLYKLKRYLSCGIVNYYLCVKVKVKVKVIYYLIYLKKTCFILYYIDNIILMYIDTQLNQ